MTTTKRVGLIGYGLAGRVFHAPLVTAEPTLDVTVVVTSNPERSAAARADLPDALVVNTSDDLFARADDLDLVVIAAANKVHVPLALAAFEHGLPVVVDKPLAPTAADAQRLVDAAAEHGTWLTVFQNRRWDSDFLTVRSLVDSGDLGEIRRFESRFERWRPALKGGWRESGDPEEAGGLLYDLGAHLVDQALVLFGPAATVYAEVDTRRPGAESDDDTFVALTHTSGVRSHLFASATAGHFGPASASWAPTAHTWSTGSTSRRTRCAPGSDPARDGERSRKSAGGGGCGRRQSPGPDPARPMAGVLRGGCRRAPGRGPAAGRPAGRGRLNQGAGSGHGVGPARHGSSRSTDLR